jgi:hypothetical protein
MHKKKYIVAVLTLAMWLFWVDTMSIADDLNNIPVAALIDSDSDSAGRGGDVASQSVVRLICVAQNTVEAGFLHKSGNIITADHVVRGCSAPEMILPTGLRATVTVIAAEVGTQVSTWGFPGGYFGLSPMLSVGYLAGIDAFKTASGKIIRQWVVNAAFNGGNSGGPLVHIKSGTIFGVVSSKLAPISSDAAYTLQILENQKFGLRYTVKKPDGTEVSFSEAQLVGKVFNELRSQVQLVIGKAVLLADLVTFLRANKIEP